MPLTRAWAIILAFLATACLAGMFLLSSNSSSGGFSDSDRAAVRAITEAGVAALEAQLQASPVQQTPAMSRDARIKEALEAKANPDDPEELPALIYNAVSEVAEETRVRTGSDMTLALVGGTGEVIAANGAVEKDLPKLVAAPVFQEAPDDQDLLFSITLGDKIYVSKLLRPDSEGRRLLAVEPLELGADSLLRRALGSTHPAGLVRKGELLGDIIGDQPVTEELIKLAKEHVSDAPYEGASKVFSVGEGMNERLGALGRIPGPAGQGDGGALLVVLSTSTAAAGQQDMAQALAAARDSGEAELPWPLLLGLLIVTVGLAFYLPGLEGLTPMRRLSREFNAIAQGTQHSVFHDRYGGAAGDVARSAAAAHEALRQAYLAELEIDEEEEDEGAESRRPRTARGRRVTRSNRNVPESRTGRSPRARGDSGPRRPSTAAPAPAPEPAATPDLDPDLEAEPNTLPMNARSRGATPPPRPPRPTPPPQSAAPPAAPASPPSTPAFTPPAPPSTNKDAYFREVYDEFVRVKTQCGEATDKLSFEKFAQKLTKNTNDIKRKKPGVQDVRFTVYVKDGKAALKAKIIKA